MLNSHHFNLKYQCGIGWNDALAFRAVSEFRRNNKPTNPTDLHPGHTLVPALDHAPLPELELERRAAVDRAVELGAVQQRAGVVRGHLVAGVGAGAGALGEDFLDV